MADKKDEQKSDREARETSPKVVPPRPEDGAEALKSAGDRPVTDDDDTVRGRERRDHIDNAHRAADAMHNNRPVVVTEAVLRASQAASAAEEAAGLQLDRVKDGRPFYIVGGVKVDPDGNPLEK